jgi:predicted nucleic acid-binding protein
VIVLDTSALLALLDADDPDHAACSASLRRERAPYVVPAGILAEVAYLVERKLGLDVLEIFLGDLAGGALTLDWGEDDLPRIAELARRYADLPLGFADASVVACAERSGGRVMTLDRRDFSVVAREGTIALALDQRGA